MFHNLLFHNVNLFKTFCLKAKRSYRFRLRLRHRNQTLCWVESMYIIGIGICFLVKLVNFILMYQISIHHIYKFCVFNVFLTSFICTCIGALRAPPSDQVLVWSWLEYFKPLVFGGLRMCSIVVTSGLRCEFIEIF